VYNATKAHRVLVAARNDLGKQRQRVSKDLGIKVESVHQLAQLISTRRLRGGTVRHTRAPGKKWACVPAVTQIKRIRRRLKKILEFREKQNVYRLNVYEAWKNDPTTKVKCPICSGAWQLAQDALKHINTSLYDMMKEEKLLRAQVSRLRRHKRRSKR